MFSRNVLLCVTLTCAIPVPAVSGVPSAGAADGTEQPMALRSRIDAIVAPYVAARDFHGVVAVQRDGEASLVLPYGPASVELGMPHRADGIFMIGSVSKQFTAAAILLLEQDGLLKTSDSLAGHLSGFPQGARITIEQMLAHTSGIADIYSLERFGATGGREGSFSEVLDDLRRMPLTHEPGAAYAYSNGGYSVLAAIIEQVSAQPYGEFLEHRIFAPLGMSSTAHDAPAPAVKNRVPGYDPWGKDSLTPVQPLAPAFTMGSGSLWSSAADLLAWTAALHGGKILNETAYAKFIRDQGHGYGHGVSIFKRFGRKAVGHDGRVAGYAADLARYVDDGVTVAILSNVQSVSRDQIRRLVAAAVFGEDDEIPGRRTFLARPSLPMESLAGVYSFGPAFNVSIQARDGRLVARANQGGWSELVPLEGEEWFSRMLYATVRFGRAADGSVDRLIWGRGERAPAGRRQVEAGHEGRPLAIVGVTVIDVARGATVSGRVVVVRHGKIDHIGPAAGYEVPGGMIEVDGRRKYLIPGLWDAHVHLSFWDEPEADEDASERDPDPEAYREVLARLVAWGVTSVRDMGGDLEAIDLWRGRIAGGDAIGPTILRAGPYVDGPKPDHLFRSFVTTPAEARNAAKTLDEKGVDFIKIHSQVPPDLLPVLAREARKRSLRLAGHVPYGTSLDDLVDLGVLTVEHPDAFFISRLGSRQGSFEEWKAAFDWYGSSDGKKLLRKMADGGLWVTPTLAVFDSGWEGTPEPWNRLRGWYKDVVGLAHAEGVGLLAGTDLARRTAAIQPGAGLHEELERMVEIGLTPTQALQTATFNPAVAFGLERESGGIEPGMPADLILLGKNPLVEIENLRSIEAVILQGRLLDAQTLSELRNDTAPR